MYETAQSELGMGKCKEPDWEAEIEKETTELKIIKNFKESLFEFIGVIGAYAVKHNSDSSIAELLGTVEIDIFEREKKVARIMKNLEK